MRCQGVWYRQPKDFICQNNRAQDGFIARILLIVTKLMTQLTYIEGRVNLSSVLRPGLDCDDLQSIDEVAVVTPDAAPNSNPDLQVASGMDLAEQVSSL